MPRASRAAGKGWGFLGSHYSASDAVTYMKPAPPVTRTRFAKLLGGPEGSAPPAADISRLSSAWHHKATGLCTVGRSLRDLLRRVLFPRHVNWGRRGGFRSVADLSPPFGGPGRTFWCANSAAPLRRRSYSAQSPGSLAKVECVWKSGLRHVVRASVTSMN